jgi:hypothetical protein
LVWLSQLRGGWPTRNVEKDSWKRGVPRVGFRFCAAVILVERQRKMPKTIAVLMILLLAAAVPVQAQPPSAHSTTRSTAAPGSALAADQFSSEQAAKAHCPGDTVVWANLGSSKAYHLSGDRYYGKTKHGAFMCQKEADQSGFHPAGRRAGKTAAKSSNANTTH